MTTARSCALRTSVILMAEKCECLLRESQVPLGLPEVFFGVDVHASHFRHVEHLSPEIGIFKEKWHFHTIDCPVGSALRPDTDGKAQIDAAVDVLDGSQGRTRLKQTREVVIGKHFQRMQQYI